jgi:hypothetical protein
MYALYQLNCYRTSMGSTPEATAQRALSIDELAAVLAEAVSKMKTGHIDMICLLIRGVAENRVEELLSLFSISQFVPSNCVAPISVSDADFLLTTLISSFSGNSSEPEGGSAKSARSFKTESPSLSFDRDHCIRLISQLMKFADAIAEMPLEVRQQAMGAAFGDCAKMEALLPEMLVNEDISLVCMKRSMSAISIDHRELCVLLNAREVLPPAIHAPTFLSSIWQLKLKEIVCLESNWNVPVIFHNVASALRSIVSKASIILQEGESEMFVESVVRSLAELRVNSPLASNSIPAERSQSVGDVCMSDESAWLDGGILEAFPECVPLYLALFLLSDLNSLVAETPTTTVAAARVVLLARCLLAEFCRAALDAGAAVVKSLCIVYSAPTVQVGSTAVASHGDAELQEINIRDVAQCATVISQLLDAVAPLPPPSNLKALTALVGFYRVVCRLERILKTEENRRNSFPVNALMLQSSLAFSLVFTSNGDGATFSSADTVRVALDLDVSILEALARADAYDLLIELLVLDMPLTRSHTCPEWYRDGRIANIVESLPLNSPWRRQVKSLV